MPSTTLHGEELTLEGSLPKVGSAAPNFVLVSHELDDVTLGTFGDTRKLIYAVPSLDTPVCAQSTIRFNQETANLGPKNVILVVSADLPFAMGRFCANPGEGTEPLKGVVALSMMRSRDFARDYGVLIADGPLAGLSARALFVLDAKNQVEHAELLPSIESEPDYDVALEKLQGNA